MYNISEIAKNFCLINVGVAWILAQIIKIFTGYFASDERFSLIKFFCGTGGMPSSHSATVMALLVSSVIEYGFASFNFAVSVLLAIIVMNDAMGVRYETGKQATVINQLVKEIFSGQSTNVNKNLKELVGHTPLQVFVGAILGAIVPFVMMLILK